MRKTQIIVITMLLAFLGLSQNAFAATKSRTAVSPYIQTDANSTYTFVGITHPSLNTAVTQIGLSVSSTGLSTQFSQSLTVNAGNTYRIFIVSTNHSTVNSTTVTGDRVLFIATTSGSSEAGNLVMTSSAFDPAANSPLSATFQNKFADLGQLTMWGAIVIPSTSTGFAMEFVGDAHDSATLLSSIDPQIGALDSGLSLFKNGRGIR